MKEVFARARQMILRPKELWLIIKNETNTVQYLFINYAAPLSLIPALAALIGLTLIGLRLPTGVWVRAPFMEALTGGILGYVFHLLGVLAGAWVVYFLAPYVGAKSDFSAAARLVIYSMTPIWLVGIFSALPGLALFQIFGLYSIYLLYLGLPVLLETPQEKTLWFTVVIVLAAILISLILTIIVGGAVYGPMFMRLMAV